MNEILHEPQTPITENSSPAQPHYAGFWIRTVAYIIDGLILSIFCWIISLPFMGYTMIKKMMLLMELKQQYGEEIPPELAIAASSSILGVALLLNLLQFIITLLYFAWQESGKYQATWGKRVVGIKVMTVDGQRISFWHGVGRFCAKILSYITLCIGFMLAGWTAKKQALHDFIASTVVVYKEN